MIQILGIFIVVIGLLMLDMHIEGAYTEQEPVYTFKRMPERRGRFTSAGGKAPRKSNG